MPSELFLSQVAVVCFLSLPGVYIILRVQRIFVAFLFLFCCFLLLFVSSFSARNISYSLRTTDFCYVVVVVY